MSLNVSLTPHLEAFISQNVDSGRFQSASELVRTALRLLEQHEQERQATLSWLRGEIQKGIESGPAAPFAADYWTRLRNSLRERDALGPHD